MVMPIYILLLCLVIETTMGLIAKIGTVYSAYAAARNAIVYSSIDPASADERARHAAVRAMVPFASSGQRHTDGTAHTVALPDEMPRSLNGQLGIS